MVQIVARVDGADLAIGDCTPTTAALLTGKALAEWARQDVIRIHIKSVFECKSVLGDSPSITVGQESTAQVVRTPLPSPEEAQQWWGLTHDRKTVIGTEPMPESAPNPADDLWYTNTESFDDAGWPTDTESLWESAVDVSVHFGVPPTYLDLTVPDRSPGHASLNLESVQEIIDGEYLSRVVGTITQIRYSWHLREVASERGIIV